MDKNKIIRLTNIISLISIILLLYWVFIFISIQVFGFKVFRENITESFYLSILGILSLLTGAVIVNVMFNLTKISDVMSGEYNKDFQKTKKYLFIGFLFSFPIIFILLYIGDLRSSAVKENHLITSAKVIVDNNQDLIKDFSQFNSDSTFITNTSHSLSILSREYESFPSISIIYQIKEKGKDIFISVGPYTNWYKQQDIVNLIFSCSPEEKEYLSNVFSKESLNNKFSSSDGNYELYYPVKINNEVIVLYCTDFQRYGKLGS